MRALSLQRVIGMGRSGHLWLCLGLLLAAQPLVAQTWVALAASQPMQAPVGSARVIVADVSAQMAEAERRLAVADPVGFQELISTAGDSAAAIALIDGTELAMGENARVRLDEFVLSDGPDASLSLQVDRGALRFVTGAMPKPAYRISTPSASLAVRGTVFDLAVGDDGTAYLAVDSGAVTVTTASGQSVDVAAGQSLGIDAAGIAGRPQPRSALPAGSLAGMIRDMDQTLAEHLAGLDAASLPDLAVLGPSRALARDLGPRDLDPRDLPGKPGFNGGGNLPDKKDRGDRGNKGKR
jgi:ferric-dicitrate binding protein FerR (iron transport regulator)